MTFTGVPMDGGWCAAQRAVAGRYRLDVSALGEEGLVATRAVDGQTGCEVLLQRIPLPEVVEAEVTGTPLRTAGPNGGPQDADGARLLRSALSAAAAVTRLRDHQRRDQLFDAIVEEDKDSLWIVSEPLAGARPLSALLTEGTLRPYRAAEIAADVLAALNDLHSQGRIHGHVTASTVMICKNGQAMLTGLAQGAVQDALCGYSPAPWTDSTPQKIRTETGSSAVESKHPARPTEARPASPTTTLRVTAGFSRAMKADAQRQPPSAAHADMAGGGHDASPMVRAASVRPARWSGPLTPLAAERARQVRIAMVGAVVERWAPEQAAPIAPTSMPVPVGPAADLWALGALLFRAVEGFPPYPEDDASELVELVCTEPAAFAENCGPLRPVVESLLRQDPLQRPAVAELYGWLRSLTRSAPECPAAAMAPVPSGPPAARLPVLRFRRQLTRPRRAPAPPLSGRHRRAGAAGPRPGKRILLAVAALSLTGLGGYAAIAIPWERFSGAEATVSDPPPADTARPPAPAPRSTSPAPAVGYTTRRDTAGFEIAVAAGWKRHDGADRHQVRYARGDFTLLVVPGRDSVRDHGRDPLAYQKTVEPELAPYRADPEGVAEGVRRVDIGQDTSMAEGQYTWTSSPRGPVYARNQALIINGKFHIIMAMGPADQRVRVTDIYEQAIRSYQVTPQARGGQPLGPQGPSLGRKVSRSWRAPSPAEPRRSRRDPEPSAPHSHRQEGDSHAQ
ncbi:serine/threonine protein kinase [Streptomyces sp. NPDC059037]|uniref:serine/threonine protein kinase n=1 Tax=Streptomyces sp. NPDC059037 TaxID=3346710 RepID=UPI00369CD6A8